MTRLRLIVADDHPLIRAGFRQLAAGDQAISVVGEAVDGRSLLELLHTTPADIVILDINMPGPGFRELIRKIRTEFPKVRVLVVSMYPEGELALEALRAGAAGYVNKAHAESELLAAVRKVGHGGRFITPALAEWLVTETEAGSSAGRRLSRREREVLELLAEGKSHKEIAAIMSISPKTIGTYRSRLLRKLNLKTTADLIRYAVDHAPKP
jgi:two-component system, NarL family, invasion response regulator UvrY